MRSRYGPGPGGLKGSFLLCAVTIEEIGDNAATGKLKARGREWHVVVWKSSHSVRKGSGNHSREWEKLSPGKQALPGVGSRIRALVCMTPEAGGNPFTLRWEFIKK